MDSFYALGWHTCFSLYCFFLQKTQKKKNLNYAVCVSSLSADYCSFLSNFFACKKYKNKKNLNYAVCVSRLSIDTVVIYQTFSRAKNAKKEEPRLRGTACRGSRLITVSFYQTFSRAKKHKKRRTSTTRYCVSRLSTGRGDRTRTCGLMVPNGPMKALSAKNSFFRPFLLGKPRSSALPNPLLPSAPKR